MRMTAHLIPTDDLELVKPIFFERIARWSRGRLAALGLEEAQRERALRAIRRALDSRGGMTRSEAMEEAARTGIEVGTEIRTHLSILAVMEGWAYLGPKVGSESAFVSAREWIGRVRPRDREDCLAELARRYFRAFAPAGERDFAAWSGLPLGDCRIGLAGITGELTEVNAGGETLLAPKGWRSQTPRQTSVRLLGAYDTYLMGYASRAHAVSPADEGQVLPGGGILRPTICVDGRFVGTWRSSRSGKKLEFELEPFGRLDPAWMEAIEAEVADIGRFENVQASVVSAP